MTAYLVLVSPYIWKNTDKMIYFCKINVRNLNLNVDFPSLPKAKQKTDTPCIILRKLSIVAQSYTLKLSQQFLIDSSSESVILVCYV